jgi:tRNA pseudouridine32 synthase/23S rRNA pseudouridine746 synthase/23S rRNA pseudouridine1911/1915/1917 synthase
VTRTLLDALQERFPDSSKTTLRKMLQADRVRVNGSTERNAKRPVASEDRIEIGSKGENADPRVTILYEDDDLLVIDKAAGLLTIASPTETEETVVAILGAKRVQVVHRLDRDSSGVLVFAKDSDMRERLQALFAAHDIERVYVAIIHGRLTEPTGTFRSYLAEDRSLHVKSTANPRKGKEAITHYRTLAAGAQYSMLEITLETGRRNQIRVHLAEAGHPIVGDTMYGAGRENPIGRLALHARHLGFVHPGTGSKLTFEVPIPEAFLALTPSAALRSD